MRRRQKVVRRYIVGLSSEGGGKSSEVHQVVEHM